MQVILVGLPVGSKLHVVADENGHMDSGQEQIPGHHKKLRTVTAEARKILKPGLRTNNAGVLSILQRKGCRLSSMGHG